MAHDFDHTGLQILDEDECWQLLESHHIGRLGVAINNKPEIYPVNYVVDGRTIVFRTAEGTKFAAAVLGTAVAFEIDAADPLFHTGWSVMVRGNAAEIERLEDLVAAERLPLTPWSSGPKTRYVRITPTAVTGRRIVHPGRTSPTTSG
ncbi:MAG TPA: pyridoxamine 5'-phosphate oxidase family protein [Microthrixaceae bacterium]|jgi:hypothetical protein|nr:pyridoxamine 5'-phosphate oxidase family protein [Microthrixaceae bacterium]